MSKRYYWLKLKDDFFDEKHIKALRKLPDGDKLVIVYLKMQLKSLKTEGIIRFDEIMPTHEEELALLLDEDISIIQLTITALEKMKIIEILNDQTIYMLAMQDLIGSEGSSAERVRQFRERQSKLMLQCNTHVTECNNLVTERREERREDLYIREDEEQEKLNIALIDEHYQMHSGAYKEVEELIDKIGIDMINLGFEIGVEQNKKSYAYVRSILNRFVTEEIKTREEYRKRADAKTATKKSKFNNITPREHDYTEIDDILFNNMVNQAEQFVTEGEHDDGRKIK